MSLLARRAFATMQLRLALMGMIVPAAAIPSLTNLEAVDTPLQGIRLAVKELIFITVMLLMRKVWKMAMGRKGKCSLLRRAASVVS